MRKRTARPKQHARAYGMAIFIGCLVGLLIIAALAIKIILLFTQSSFDGKHQFVVALKEARETRFVIFNPDSQVVSSLLYKGTLPQNPMISLGAPIDGTLVSSKDISSPSDLVNTLLFHHDLKTTLTPIDAINLFVFLHTAANSTHQSFDTTPNNASNTQIFSKAFYNETIFTEGKTVAIVNGTNISGLGTVLAVLLKNMGANVVSVTTADTPSPKSYISYTGESSYTLSRFVHLLKLPTVHLSGVAISDITITLGTDKTSVFE